MRKTLRKILIGLLLAVCTFSTYYFHFVLKEGVLFSHLFYVPIVLAGMWFGMGGVAVPVFLAAVLLGTHFLSGLPEPYIYDVVRAAMFIAVGYIIARVSEERGRRIKELKATSELKDLFSDIVRHDLMNYISGLYGVYELLRGEELPGVEHEVEILKEESDNLKRMINDATIYARLDSPNSMGFEDRDLSDAARTSVEEMRGEAGKRGIELVNKLKGSYPVRGNPFLGNVFLNLISNAVKYSPEGSRIVLDIEDSGALWKVSVKDSGPGIPDEYKEDIFHRFERRDKGGVRGSGLGLAIVEKIVEMHKGRAWVEDNPGGGSIFYFTIPKGQPEKH